MKYHGNRRRPRIVQPTSAIANGEVVIRQMTPIELARHQIANQLALSNPIERRRRMGWPPGTRRPPPT